VRFNFGIQVKKKKDEKINYTERENPSEPARRFSILAFIRVYLCESVVNALRF
jgi:hypothetical protein